MVRVKICGITNWADAALALEAGANALGFNFYAPSPRYIPPSHARMIVSRMPPGVDAVGVFVNAGFAEANEIGLAIDLDVLQLHGDEPPEAVAEFSDSWPLIKAFRVGPEFRAEQLETYRRHTDFFLLDGFSHDARGGTGNSFDWSVAREAKQYGRIFLSGGLTVENVGDAIRQVRPFAVDVCSGVEASPGKKDAARVREFIRTVKEASREIAQ
ncbi:MAG: phosphoribosylanthranilate isomerase [Acidobacteria bacterium]|nr:phosphoribosylanthranilate isomerase [Acidobacteriota bacterium]